MAWRLVWIVAVASLMDSGGILAQTSYPSSYPCVNDVPNPYQRGASFASPPDGRAWGATAGVAVAPDGTIWAYDRCGANSCSGSLLDPIIAFATDGKVIRHFGSGVLQTPHGLSVDYSGNVWVADSAAKDGKGMQVYKFDPEGRLLMTLGQPGGGDLPNGFFQPTAIAVARSGDIYVAQGHTEHGDKSLIVKFSASGNFLASFGGKGSGPGELDVPHGLAFDDANGHLLVADRNNNRIAIFSGDGAYLGEWKQFGRPSAITVKDQMVYVADSESQEKDARAYAYNPGCQKGIRFGKADDGKVMGLVPDQQTTTPNIPEGLAIDDQGNIFGAQVAAKDLKKYVKK